MDELNILLRAKLDLENSVKNINKEIKTLQTKLEDLKISINVDGIDKVFKDMAKEVAKQMGSTKIYDGKDTKKEIDETIKDFKQLQKEIDRLKSEGFKKGKVSTSFIDVGDGENLKRIVTEYNDGLKNTIKITENISTETGELVSVEKLVVDNIKKRNEEQEKYVKNVELSKQAIGELVAKSRSIGKNFDGFVDDEELSKIRRDLSAIGIDSEDIDSNFKNISESIKKAGKSLEDVEKKAKKTKESIQLAQIKQSEDNDKANSKLEYDIDKAHYQALKKNEELKQKAYNEEITQLDYIRKKKQQINEIDRQINKAKFEKGIDIDYGEILSIQDKLNSFYEEGNTLNKEQKAIVESMISDLQRKLKLEKDSVDVADKYVEAQNRANALKTKLSDVTVKNDKYNKDTYQRLKEDIDRVVVSYQKGEIASNKFEQELKELEVRASSFGVEAKKLSSTTNSFSDSLKRFTAFYGLYDVFQLGKRTISSMVSSIFELDHALVELQKTSDLTGNSLNKFIGDAYTTGQKLARTGTEVINASAEFSKAGYGSSELANLAHTALLLTNVGDGISDVSDASGTLISAMKGFDIEGRNAIDIVDKINAVSNSTASNFEDISFGLERMSGTLGMAGASIDETIGMFTAVNEVLRNSEIVSSGLSSLFMRMRGLSEDTGDSIDGLSAKLEDLYATVGVEMVDENGQLRDTFDVLQDLSKVWGQMSVNQKQYFAQESAGIRQAKVFTTLMNQFSTVNESITTSLNSSGSAMAENEKYLNSLEGKVNNVKSAFEQLATTTVNSDFVKWILDFTAGAIKLADSLGGLIPIMTSILGLLIATKSTSIISFIQNFSVGVNHLGVSFTRAYAAIGLYNKGMITGKALTMSMTPIIGALTFAISGVVMGINAWKQAEEEKLRKAQENVNAYQSEIKKTNELMDSYKKLAKSDKSSIENREELISIQKQLAEQYGIEVRSLDLVNKSMEDNISIMDDAIEKKKRYYEIDNARVQKDLDKQLNYARFLPNVAGTSKEFKNGVKDILDTMQKEFDVYGKNGQFTIKINPELNNEQALEALGKLWKQLELKGQKGTMFYDTVSEAYLALSDAMTNANGNIEKAAENASKELDGVDGSGKNVVHTLTDINKISESLNESFKNATDSVDDFTSILDDLEEGNGLTAKSIQTIIEKYPELIQYIGDEVALQQKVTEMSNKSKDEQVENLNYIAYMQSENFSNMEGNISSYFGNLGIAYTSDFENYKSMEEAKQGVTEQLINGLKLQWKNYFDAIGTASAAFGSAYKVEHIADIDPRMLDKNSEYFSQELYDRYEMQKQELTMRQYQMEKAKKDIDAIFANSGYSPKDITLDYESGGSGKGKDKVTDKFKKDLEEISSLREKVEMEIAELQEAINLDELLGEYDPNKANKMTDLLSQLKEISKFEIDSYNTLLTKYKTEEQQLEIKSLISEANRKMYEDEQSYLQNVISSITRKNELDKKSHEERLSQYELEQMWIDDSSKEYIELERQKISDIEKLQLELSHRLQELRGVGLSDESEYIKDLKKMWYGYENERIALIKSNAEKEKQIHLNTINDKIEQLEKQKKSVEDLNDLTIKYIKKEANERKKAIQDEISGYEKVVSAKKKSLRDEYEQDNYEYELQEKEDVIVNIREQLIALDGDGSEAAKIKRLKLMEELKKAERDKEKFQNDKSIKNQEDRLDEELDNFKEEKNKELQVVEDFLSDEGAIRKKALELLDKRNKDLYNKLKKYNDEYAVMAGDSFDELWTDANTAISLYEDKNKSLLDVMREITLELKKQQELQQTVSDSKWNDYVPPTTDTGTNNSNLRTIQKMKDNSSKWQAASDDEKKRLSDENQQLGQSIGAYYDNNTGTWYTNVSKKQKLYDTIGVYHTGGIAGRGMGNDAIIDPRTEVFSKLMIGEPITTQVQAANFVDRTLPELMKFASGGDGGTVVEINVENLMSIDKIDNSTDVRKITEGVIKNLTKELSKVGITAKIR